MTNKITQHNDNDEFSSQINQVNEVDMSRGFDEESANKLASSVEMLCPLFQQIKPSGIELINLLGFGTEKTNHDALVNFIYQSDDDLLYLPASDQIDKIIERLASIISSKFYISVE